MLNADANAKYIRLMKPSDPLSSLSGPGAHTSYLVIVFLSSSPSLCLLLIVSGIFFKEESNIGLVFRVASCYYSPLKPYYLFLDAFIYENSNPITESSRMGRQEKLLCFPL